MLLAEAAETLLCGSFQVNQVEIVAFSKGKAEFLRGIQEKPHEFHLFEGKYRVNHLVRLPIHERCLAKVHCLAIVRRLGHRGESFFGVEDSFPGFIAKQCIFVAEKGKLLYCKTPVLLQVQCQLLLATTR